ncbi:helix-turn-helix domain-containing protein [Vibrio vulnificus]|uniref:helix-turn-helix domain-containing protein n=1 Tax=Vibrio vulnificus TaxID=672 RepID=UPI00405A47E6
MLAAFAKCNGSGSLNELCDVSGLPRSSTEDILKKVLSGEVATLRVKREQGTFTAVNLGNPISSAPSLTVVY